MTKNKNSKIYSFRKGYAKVKREDSSKIKDEIMAALGYNPKSRSSWWRRLNGKLIPDLEEAAKIEKIFSKYGITEIWGHERKSRTNKT